MPATLGKTLLSWYRHHGRDLPWRKTRDPYRILVSEIMLQQTQVSRVIDFYHRWLKQFPIWSDLAKASNQNVIKAWSGLGYNRRALMLRDIAKHVVEHGLPNKEDAWRQIKGIGPYTAAAISAFSQQKRTLPIDTNIRRVISRILFKQPFPDQSIDEQIQKHLDQILPKSGAFYDVPQAIFDLATSVCTKKPSCAICPMKSQCKSATLFLTNRIHIPKQSIKKAIESKHRNKPYPDRIYRGRILKLIQEQPAVSIKKIGPIIDSAFDPKQDSEWLNEMLKRMRKDGLIEHVSPHK